MGWPRILLVTAAGAALFGAAPVALGTGVSIDVGRISVTETLQPGGSYVLPAFGVRNPSPEITNYYNTVTYVDDQAELRPPEAWFSFDPPRLTLEGGSSHAVSTTLVVPAGAEPGVYSALIGPMIDKPQTGASVGAGAAARLTFTVGASSELEAWARGLWTFLLERPWLFLIGLLLAALVIAAYLRRRFSFTVTRRS